MKELWNLALGVSASLLSASDENRRLAAAIRCQRQIREDVFEETVGDLMRYCRERFEM
jgi:hypothetical protein